MFILANIFYEAHIARRIARVSFIYSQITLYDTYLTKHQINLFVEKYSTSFSTKNLNLKILLQCKEKKSIRENRTDGTKIEKRKF